MGYQPSHANKINIHVGALRGSKERSLARFAGAVDQLSPACRARLTGACHAVVAGLEGWAGEDEWVQQQQ